ncbi:MAG: hypothetical protein JNK38_14195 [Acidobacteria bacterium]|nr:hypothetical protein [Acidobacteriota bacterium]
MLIAPDVSGSGKMIGNLIDRREDSLGMKLEGRFADVFNHRLAALEEAIILIPQIPLGDLAAQIRKMMANAVGAATKVRRNGIQGRRWIVFSNDCSNACLRSDSHTRQGLRRLP